MKTHLLAQNIPRQFQILRFLCLKTAINGLAQARGCFVQGANMTLPGDGEATIEWSGSGKDALYVGRIGKSVTNNTGGNTITLVSGDGAQFKKAIGALVMIVEADGTTRSADTSKRYT